MSALDFRRTFGGLLLAGALATLSASDVLAGAAESAERYPVTAELNITDHDHVTRVLLGSEWLTRCPDPTSYLILGPDGGSVPFAILTSDDAKPPSLVGARWEPAETPGGWSFLVHGPAEPREVLALRLENLPRGLILRAKVQSSGRTFESLLWNLPNTGAGTQIELRLPPDMRSGPWVVAVERIEGFMPPFRKPGLDLKLLLSDELGVERVSTPIAIEGPIPVQEGASELQLRLPRPGLPLRGLELSVKGEYFSRAASLYGLDPGSSDAGGRIGSGRLERIRQGGVSLGSTELAFEGASMGDLALRVDDGRSPPLDFQGATLFLRGAVLLVPAEKTGTHQILACGKSGRTYDLDRMRGRMAESRGPVVSPGPPRVNPLWTAAKATGLAATPGPAPQGARFSSSREILRDGAPAHVLLRVPLDAATLSTARDDLGDLRVLDDQDRQIPYILGKNGIPFALQGVVQEARQEGSITRISLDLGLPELPIEALILSTSRGDFTRVLRVSTSASGKPGQLLREVEWEARGVDGPVQQVIPLHRRVPGRILLSIDNGDNPPLPLEEVRVTVPSQALWLIPPIESTMRLFAGDPGLRAPSYDLADLRRDILELPSARASLGPVEQLRLPLKAPRAGLVLAAVGILSFSLLFLIARLVRKP